MENTTYNVKELAHKLMQGTISPDEKIWLDAWYANFSDEEVLLSASKYQNPEQLQESILNKITAQMGTPGKPARKVITLWRSIAAAAAVVLLVTFAALYKNEVLEVIDPAKQVELVTAPGKHRQISLPDGTRIWLSPGSHISYPDKFRTKERLVKLEGEAFFDVVHDEDHPFVIQSGQLKTVVLGTSFNVKAYPDQIISEVTVISGKVAVQAHDLPKSKQAVMVLNQRAVYNKTDRSLIKENYPNASKFLSQRTGLFSYDGSSLQTVADDLANQYGISLRLAPGIAQKGFYGHINTNEQVDKTLNKLCAVMDLRWNRVDNEYYLQPLPLNN
ncbi:ferric-dicitrate binding protein FerR, regulates iron transport through sigma-19 [Mucilaginibacter gossypiicola]|uniref:Ferric-dicitrate binding protein FerR, regulates iron transport through sigma-19 n=1 Tax=Mucilaginibacter gossypiicola TaxID=551995 RepID=A0A1H8HDE5_9SPHI|nr:FecR domain-containing protein [Mucilaginibacter gossypiicola]SEN53887.1 ferric-dicitrate binding protein FerR, regulates iron transport through sigma-19 [Mucilaginibacter gossypiicola]